MKLTDQEWKTLRFGDTDEAKESFEQLCEKIKHQAVEEALRVLPGVVTSLIQHSSGLKVASDKFYDDNRDLAAHKQLVSEVLFEMEASNPGLELSKLMKKTAEETRRRLTLINNTDYAKTSKPNVDHLAGMLGGE